MSCDTRDALTPMRSPMTRRGVQSAQVRYSSIAWRERQHSGPSSCRTSSSDSSSQPTASPAAGTNSPSSTGSPSSTTGADNDATRGGGVPSLIRSGTKPAMRIPLTASAMAYWISRAAKVRNRTPCAGS